VKDGGNGIRRQSHIAGLLGDAKMAKKVVKKAKKTVKKVAKKKK
jgi:hypothetical protein